MGGGIGMGNTCKPMAVSFQCMTKFTTNLKKIKNKTYDVMYGNIFIHHLKKWLFYGTKEFHKKCSSAIPLCSNGNIAFYYYLSWNDICEVFRKIISMDSIKKIGKHL